MRHALASLTLVAFCASQVQAQNAGGCTAEAMLVFDASGSMASMGYNGLDLPRIVEARDAVRRALPRITQVRNLGLVTYGPGPRDSCDNINLRVLPERNSASRIIAEIDALQPDGDTPLTQSVRTAVDVLEERGGGGEVVLVTDGRETCLGEPCALAADLAEAHRGITVHVIGFRVRPANFQWQGAEGYPQSMVFSVAECLSDRTGGMYVPAENTQELEEALLSTLGCAILSERRREEKARG